MLVFISHSFKDKAQFENLNYLLENQKIECWSLGEIRSGENLADQLRKAILKCDVCVFLATNNSVEASWCAAELGAFWGAGKPVLIYQPETNLNSEKLPKQFNGHFIETRLKGLVDAIKDKNATIADEKKIESKSSIEIETIREMIESAFIRILNIDQIHSTFSQLSKMLKGRDDTNVKNDGELRALLSRLLMRDQSEILHSIADFFQFKFTLLTTTGFWSGYAQDQTVHADGDVYVNRHCILFLFDERLRTKSVAIVEQVIEGLNRGVTGTRHQGSLVSVGKEMLGEAIFDQNFPS